MKVFAKFERAWLFWNHEIIECLRTCYTTFVADDILLYVRIIEIKVAVVLWVRLVDTFIEMIVTYSDLIFHRVWRKFFDCNPFRFCKECLVIFFSVLSEE